MYSANLGDSRLVLSREGNAFPLSHDHKPNSPGEKQRIEEAGKKFFKKKIILSKNSIYNFSFSLLK
jgi:serine/threonine protein phosphatase PrpC